MANRIRVGDKAPDFTLPDTHLKLRSLKDFLGRKIVLAFFVSAFTRVCTKEMCAFRDSIIRLTNLGAQVIGISVNDPFSNKAFAQKNRLAFPVLSDYNREIIRTSYGIERARRIAELLRTMGNPMPSRTIRLHSLILRVGCTARTEHSRRNRYGEGPSLAPTSFCLLAKTQRIKPWFTSVSQGLHVASSVLSPANC